MVQPLTAAQLAIKIGARYRQCAQTLRDLQRQGHMDCLTPTAVNHRVYFWTKKGRACQEAFLTEQGLSPPTRDFPEVDWSLYARVCSIQRSQIIRSLHEPMQPCEIKKRVLLKFPEMRMSRNSCRDAVQVLLSLGVVRRIQRKKSRHPAYELTDTGKDLRRLLIAAHRWAA